MAEIPSITDQTLSAVAVILAILQLNADYPWLAIMIGCGFVVASIERARRYWKRRSEEMLSLQWDSLPSPYRRDPRPEELEAMSQTRGVCYVLGGGAMVVVPILVSWLSDSFGAGFMIGIAIAWGVRTFLISSNPANWRRMMIEIYRDQLLFRDIERFSDDVEAGIGAIGRGTKRLFRR